MSRGVAGLVRRLFESGTLAGLGEGALLDRFVSRGDHDAFAAIVIRHGPMVQAVCRRFLRRQADVDDAVQATFLVLARKAAGLRRKEAVGPWLHGVAYKVARRAQARSASAPVSLDDATPIATAEPGPWACVERDEAARLLHEEIARLPEKYRAPVVLCHLEGLTHDQAAERLRWPVGTVRGRLARARETLKCRLARRGLEGDDSEPGRNAPIPERRLTATIPIPVAVARSLPDAAFSFATRKLGGTTTGIGASPAAFALAREVLNIMTSRSLLICSALGAAAIGTAAGTAWAFAHEGDRDQPVQAVAKADLPPLTRFVDKPAQSPSRDSPALRAARKQLDEKYPPSQQKEDTIARVKAAQNAYDHDLALLVDQVTEPQVDVELGMLRAEAIKTRYAELMTQGLALRDRGGDASQAARINDDASALSKELGAVLRAVETARLQLDDAQSRLDDLKARPRPNERVEIRIGDRVDIEVLEALPGRPITGERLVKADGTVALDFYGKVHLAGLTTEEAKVKVILLLRRFLADETLGLVEFDEANNPVLVEPLDSDRAFVDIAADRPGPPTNPRR